MIIYCNELPFEKLSLYHYIIETMNISSLSLSLSLYIYILLYLLYRLQLILFPTLFLIYFLYYYAEEDEFLFEIDRDEYIVDLANGMINI